MDATRRLTNLLGTDVSYNLPFPTGLSEGDGLNEWAGIMPDPLDVEQVAAVDPTMAHDICRLLSRADISYVKPVQQFPTVPNGAQGLRAQVLHHDNNVFTANNAAKPRRAGANRAARGATQRAPQAAREEVVVPEPASEMEVEGAPKRNRRSQRDMEYDPEADKKAIAAFEDLLDETFTRTDVAEADSGAVLSIKDLAYLDEEVARMRSRGLLPQVSVGHLTQLLTLLDGCVGSCEGELLDDDDTESSDTFCAIKLGMEACVVSLNVMTAAGMPKRVYNEDNIDRIIEAVRYHIVQNVFVAFDASMRAIHRGDEMAEGAGDAEEEEGGGGKGKKKSKKGKRKSGAGPAKKASAAAKALLGRVNTLVGLLSDLLLVEQLQERTVNQVVTTCLHTLEVSGVQLLQLRAVALVALAFGRYRELRTSFMDEIVTCMMKLPTTKKTLRQYPLPEEDASSAIQMSTALVLQCIQGCVELPPAIDANTDPEGSAAALEANPYEPAITWSDSFWTTVYQRWPAAKEREVDMRVIVDNALDDLVTCRCLPEWPAADTLLHRFCVKVVLPGMTCADVAIRQATVDLLGKVATKTKGDESFAEGGNMPILMGTEPEEGVSGGFDDAEARQMRALLDEIRRQMVKQMQEAGPGAPLQLRHSEVVQEALCSYLADPIRQDPSAASAARVYALVRTYADDTKKLGLAEKLASLLWYRVRAEPRSAAAVSETVGAALRRAQVLGGNAPPARALAVCVCRAHIQSGHLARNANVLLTWLLDFTAPKQAPLTRTRGVRALAAVAEADSRVLGNDRVLATVQRSFEDESISVREAAVELVGRHMAVSPEMAQRYFPVVARGVADTGVSVRKRAVKILRDVCMSQPEFPLVTDALVKIISRISDPELPIQELVAKTFTEMWLAPGSDHELSSVEVRAGQLMHVLGAVYRTGGPGIHVPLPRSNHVVGVIHRALEAEAKLEGSRKRARSATPPVRAQCESLCRYLLEALLRAEEEAGDEEGVGLPAAMAMHAFCLADPTLCCPSRDRNKFVTTLLPYLKQREGITGRPTDEQRRSAEQQLCLIAVISSLLPHVGRLPAVVEKELDDDLKDLTMQHGYTQVVVEAARAQCALGRVSERAAKSTVMLVRLYQRTLEDQARLAPHQQKLGIIQRALFTVGHLCRFGASTIENAADDVKASLITLDRCREVFMLYFQSGDMDVRTKALEGLGCLCTARPKMMLAKGMNTIVQGAFDVGAHVKLKDRVLRNFADLVKAEEDRMVESQENLVGDARAERGVLENGENGGRLAVVVGQNDDNLAGGIVQRYWKEVLNLATDASAINPHQPEGSPANALVRRRVLELCDVVLRQGMVHPMSCFAPFIALSTDPSPQVRAMAQKLLRQETEKHMSFFESRLSDGLTLAHRFRRALHAAFPRRGAEAGNRGPRAPHSAVAGLGEVYKIVRESKPQRARFLATAIRPLESTAAATDLDMHYLGFCADVLASLPYLKVDEPLLVVHTVNRIVALRAGSVLETLKTAVGGKDRESSGHGLVGAAGGAGGAGGGLGGTPASPPPPADMTQHFQQMRQDMEVEAAQVSQQVAQSQEMFHGCQMRVQQWVAMGADQMQVQMADEECRTAQMQLQQLMQVEQQMHLRHRVAFQQMNAHRAAQRAAESETLSFEQVQAETCTSIVICLALLLKRHLKSHYGLTDSKIQQFNPHDTTRKDERVGVVAPVGLMEMHGLDLNAARSLSSVKSHYKLFKKLMGEDSNDYAITQFSDEDWEEMEQGTPGFLGGASGGKSGGGARRGRGRKSAGTGRGKGGGSGRGGRGGGGRSAGGKAGGGRGGRSTAKKRKKRANSEDDDDDDDDDEDFEDPAVARNLQGAFY